MTQILPILLFISIAAFASGSETWTGTTIDPARNEPFKFALELKRAEDGQVTGSFYSFYYYAKLRGTYEADTQRFLLNGTLDVGVQISMDLSRTDEGLAGVLAAPSMQLELPLKLELSAVSGSASIGMYEVLTSERPSSVFKNQLTAAAKSRVEQRILSEINKQGMVGVSVALINQQQVEYMAGFGYEDNAERIVVSENTMYRWASISKPMTAVIAMLLVKKGSLNLDQDIRSQVPEFPAKPWAITARSLLTHQSGIVHYHPGKVIVSQRQYDQEHPFADRVLSLDKFKQSDLLFEPGTQFSYSTPGYVLLGAVLERAADLPYENLVETTIKNPLALSSLQPDFTWSSIDHRATGYLRRADGVITNSTEGDVAWKLPAGGFISTISDLAEFARALLGDQLLDPELKSQMWQKQKTASGEEIEYGYGFNVSDWDGLRVIWHSGGQKKTSTIMVLCPDQKAGVVIMSNTEKVRHESLSKDLLKLLIDSRAI